MPPRKGSPEWQQLVVILTEINDLKSALMRGNYPRAKVIASAIVLLIEKL